MPKLKGNKGEWSEIYAFLRLLELGKLYAADSDLNKMDGIFYNIIKILRSEDIGNLEFRIDKQSNVVTVVNGTTDEIYCEVAISDFKAAADRLYDTIVSATTSSFEDENTENFLDSIYVGTLKAKSTDKADIRINIHDINTGIDSVQGFSIKSRLGSPSTLINAGKTTNFIFEVTGNINDEVADQFNTCSKLFKQRFAVLKDTGCDLNYIGMTNDIFEGNLLLIDGDLPKICSFMLRYFYRDGVNHVVNSLEKITDENPLNYNLSQGHPFYVYKFKKLLSECALGMLPASTWDGTADATGGYIVVREDGEVLCYHLFNRNEFEDYLVKNTKFETASTSRHDFGYIYKENDKYYLKLNLQIRFIK